MTTPAFDNPSLNTDGETRLDFGHVGGTSTVGDPDSWYPELWTWLIREFALTSMLDVGCGIGLTQKFFEESGLRTVGLDCPQMTKHHVLNNPSVFIGHDLTEYAWFCSRVNDLVWCCEMAEHLEERFVDNLIRTLVSNCDRVLAFCAAPPGAGGYHHVNCQPVEYWMDKLTAAGMVFDAERTQLARGLCDASHGRSAGNYFGRSGLIFTR